MNWEFSFLYALHSLRSDYLNPVFIFLNYLDTEELWLLLVPFIYFAVDRRWGIRIFYLVLLNVFVSYFLKDIFQSLRPSHIDPSMGLVSLDSFGFPSGAAQTAAIAFGLIVYLFCNKWGWIAGVNVFFWLSFSRLWLGVHFPTDLMFGWLVGGVLITCFILCYQPLEKRLSRIHSQIIPPLFFLLSQSTLSIRLCFIAMGFGLFLRPCGLFPKSGIYACAMIAVLAGIIYGGEAFLQQTGFWQYVLPFYFAGFVISLIDSKLIALYNFRKPLKE